MVARTLITAEHGLFSRIRQVAFIYASFNTWLLGPHESFPPNGISIGSAVFAGITNVTNTQTHRPRHSRNTRRNSPHIWPENKKNSKRAKKTKIWSSNSEVYETRVCLPERQIVQKNFRHLSQQMLDRCSPNFQDWLTYGCG